MASDSPCKADINTIFKRLRSIPTNKQCFDCGANLPTWASVTYGVFLCIDCSATHRGLGVHVTFIRSTQLDTSWTWLQLRAMQTGGNAAATAFFRQHGCITKDSQQKYHSRAAQMYREKLHGMAIKNMKLYGTKLHIDSSEATSPTADQKEIDFFKEHHDKPVAPPTIGEGQSLFVAPPPSEPLPIANGSLSKKADEPAEDPGIGPSVDHALSMSPTEAQQVAEPRKVTIGARKPQSAKKGMGAKKSMGAQRVKANFSDLENEAQRKDKERAEMAGNLANQRAREEEDDSKRMASMKLAYKDLNLEDKKREEMMKKMDPKKREQMERLGMGSFGNTTRGTGHSAFDNMQTIKQETPTSGSSHNTYDRFSKNTDDDFEIIGTSGPPKYDSPFGLKEEDRYSNWSSSSSKKSTWDNDRYDSKTSTIEDISTHNKEDDRGRSRKNYEVSSSDEAQKKFGNAKAISSDAYFGNKNPDFETKQNLAKFEGQSSISSADFYGGGPNSSGTRGRQENYSDGPDLADIKEGVRQGVTKVAGRLSNLANGVINSIQDNYG